MTDRPMTAPWMPPLPEPTAWRVDESFFSHYDCIPFALLPPIGAPKPLYNADQMRQAQADAARAALEQAAKVCDRVNNYDNPMTATDCADAIRALAKEITP